MAKPGCTLDPKLLLDMAANDFWKYSGRFMIGFTALLGYQSFPKPAAVSTTVRQSVVASNVQGPTSQLTRWKVTDVENKVYHPNVHFECIVRIQPVESRVRFFQMQLVDGVFISMFVLMFVFLVRCKRNLLVYGAQGFGSCIIYLDDCDSWEHVP